VYLLYRSLASAEHSTLSVVAFLNILLLLLLLPTFLCNWRCVSALRVPCISRAQHHIRQAPAHKRQHTG
jgi:hypothetical protein